MCHEPMIEPAHRMPPIRRANDEPRRVRTGKAPIPKPNPKTGFEFLIFLKTEKPVLQNEPGFGSPVHNIMVALELVQFILHEHWHDQDVVYSINWNRRCFNQSY